MADLQPGIDRFHATLYLPQNCQACETWSLDAEARLPRSNVEKNEEDSGDGRKVVRQAIRQIEMK